MKSCIYEGRVRHRRFSPVPHAFAYRLFHLYLDIEELPGLFRGRWFWSAHRPAPARFRREDHLGDPQVPLDRAVRDLVEAQGAPRPGGPIRLLTHLRYFGYGFNPVSFYYCWDASDRTVETVVAEVDNTPWGERHCYVLTEARNEATAPRKRFRFPKAFHVSPFIGMDVDYDWRFTEPGERLLVHMEGARGGVKFFDATMGLRRTPIAAGALARVLAQYPFLTAKVIGAIYWQAFRLWWKRCPFHPHPKTRVDDPARNEEKVERP